MLYTSRLHQAMPYDIVRDVRIMMVELVMVWDISYTDCTTDNYLLYLKFKKNIIKPFLNFYIL